MHTLLRQTGLMSSLIKRIPCCNEPLHSVQVKPAEDPSDDLSAMAEFRKPVAIPQSSSHWRYETVLAALGHVRSCDSGDHRTILRSACHGATEHSIIFDGRRFTSRSPAQKKIERAGTLYSFVLWISILYSAFSFEFYF